MSWGKDYSLQFDLDLGFRALAEVPDLARMPLGVMAIYSQVAAHMSDRARVTQLALEGHLVRAGLERPEFGGNWSGLDATG